MNSDYLAIAYSFDVASGVMLCHEFPWWKDGERIDDAG
jgi:hypothetical protein